MLRQPILFKVPVNLSLTFPPPLDQQTPVAVTLSPNVLELAPGASGNFTAIFSLNDGFDSSRVPVYSGYITVSSSAEADGGDLTIPFMGVAVDMTTLPLFNDTNQPFTTSEAQAPNGIIAGDGSTVFTMQGEDLPTVERWTDISHEGHAARCPLCKY